MRRYRSTFWGNRLDDFVFVWRYILTALMLLAYVAIPVVGAAAVLAWLLR